jgi:hypothetical protein
MSLNSWKNKDKSEGPVSCSVLMPGMYETGPRYHQVQRALRRQRQSHQLREPSGDLESAHSVSNSPVRGISTSMPHSKGIHCRPTCAGYHSVSD